MTQADPFAAAQISSPAPVQTIPASAPQVDPFNGVDVDMADPFATAEDVKGGTYRPSPRVDDLNERLIVMIPRKFRSDYPIPKDYIAKGSNKTTQDLYIVDLYILGNEPLTFTYKETDQTTQVETRKDVTIPAEEMPAEFLGKYIYQAALVGQLRRVDGTAKPLLMGVMRRGPQAKDRGSKTFDSIRAEFAEYARQAAAGRVPPSLPSFSWQVDTAITPDQRVQAMAWWTQSQGRIAKPGKAIDVTGTPTGNGSQQ
jgi:hypothetical protein